jgi:hypothetical protein
MKMTIDCPRSMAVQLTVAAAMSEAGARLEAVEDEPVGPWLAALVASIDVNTLHLRARTRHLRDTTSTTRRP